MITLILEPQLDFPSIVMAGLLMWLSHLIAVERIDLYVLSRRFGWGHGGLAFVLVVARMNPRTSGDLLWILLRSMVACAIGTGLWAMLLVLLERVCFEPIRAIRFARWAARLKVATDQMKLADAAYERQRQERAERNRELVALEWARTAPERERLRLAVENRQLIDADASKRASQRREESRLRSDLVYQQYARQLGPAFPRKRFDQFIERYLSDDVSPEEVERREQQLKQMMLDSLGTSTPTKFSSVTELAAYFRDRREEIDNLPHDEEVKDTYRIQLNKQEDEALRRLLKP